jgi:hypothetical protein
LRTGISIPLCPPTSIGFVVCQGPQPAAEVSLAGADRFAQSAHREEKPERGDGSVDQPGADLLLRNVQSKVPNVLLRRRIGRPTEEGREVPHVPNVVPPGIFAEPAP